MLKPTLNLSRKRLERICDKMKLKKIQDYISNIVGMLEVKSDSENRKNEHTEGQLYEARYILEYVEKIIYTE